MGELLVESGMLAPEQLEMALAEQRETGARLGDILINSGYITEQQLVEVLEFQLGIPHVILANMKIDPEVLKLVPERLAETYVLIPYRKVGNRLHVAMADPLDYYAIDDLRRSTNLVIMPSIATRQDIQAAISRHYRGNEVFESAIRSIAESALQRPEPEQESRAADSPVVRALNQILVEAADAGASDVHLDPQADGVVLRFRVDGFLRTERVIPRNLQSGLVARVKIMARLNIAEQRLPQDGRFEFSEEGHRVDVRVSTMPTAHGEKVVLRVFDLGKRAFTMHELGFSPENLARFERMITRPYGAVLITGPTGSGKTSTLYAALKRLSTPEVNVITIEDPIEYQLEGVNQVQVNPAAGLTFARGLRAILRQDPDIIMVGEIRDNETAEIAMRAALTGHRVLSTLHTNDAASAINRLMDMGVPPYMMASGVTGVVAQRLVRVICSRCKRERAVTPLEREIFEENGLAPESVVEGTGCPACGHTGFKGRMAVQEVLEVDDEIARLILTSRSTDEYVRAAKEQGMRTMFQDGLEKALQGKTTLQEVLRVTAVT